LEPDLPTLRISQLTVTDGLAYGEYTDLAALAILAHGGRFIAFGAWVVQLEGTGRLRNVIVKFATLEANEACYRSSVYKLTLEYAKAASE
jgi:uncharacterized protein (DUF1330 family)